MPIRILSAAGALPARRVSNRQLEETLGLSPGSIARRTGIEYRPVASPDESTSDLAVQAGHRVLKAAGVNQDQVTLLLLATSTPDYLLPPTAPHVADRLGLRAAGAVDVAGACAGFLYALSLAEAFIRVRGGLALVIGANVLSRRINPRDRATASLFADGAGGVVLGAGEKGQGLLSVYLGSRGSLFNTVWIPAGGTRTPLTPERLEAGDHLMRVDEGPTFFREAVRAMAEAGQKAMAAAGVDAGDIDWWIPHQGHQRITFDVGKMLGIPPDRTVNVIGQIGNSSAATIPLALAQMIEQGKIQTGHTLLLTAVGAGLVSAGVVVRW